MATKRFGNWLIGFGRKRGVQTDPMFSTGCKPRNFGWKSIVRKVGPSQPERESQDKPARLKAIFNCRQAEAHRGQVATYQAASVTSLSRSEVLRPPFCAKQVSESNSRLNHEAWRGSISSKSISLLNALIFATLTRTLSPKRNFLPWRRPLIRYSFS